MLSALLWTAVERRWCEVGQVDAHLGEFTNCQDAGQVEAAALDAPPVPVAAGADMREPPVRTAWFARLVCPAWTPMRADFANDRRSKTPSWIQVHDAMKAGLQPR
jgi:hypothetical protein